MSGQALTQGNHKELFATLESVDRRSTATAGVLASNVEQHSVPMFVGTAPALVLGSGAAATLWIVRRRLQLNDSR